MTGRPRFRVSATTLSSPDTVRLAAFYERLLGWTIVQSDGGWIRMRPPSGGAGLSFHHEDNYTRPVWPTADGQQAMMLHLDIGTEDLQAGIDWALEAGAVLADHQPQPDVRVLLDPDGHPFCLFRSGPRSEFDRTDWNEAPELPLITRLLLDAQLEFVRAADAVPEAARDERTGSMNTAGWIIAHTAFIHDVWLNVDAQSRPVDNCDEWLLAWDRQQRAANTDPNPRLWKPIKAPFDEARAALDRILGPATSFIEMCSDDVLGLRMTRDDNGWSPDTTVGYLVARASAHLFAHAAELNVIATAAGAVDVGLPGGLPHTSGRA